MTGVVLRRCIRLQSVVSLLCLFDNLLSYKSINVAHEVVGRSGKRIIAQIYYRNRWYYRSTFNSCLAHD